MEKSNTCLCSRPDIIHIPTGTTCLSCGHVDFNLENRTTEEMRISSDPATRNPPFSYNPLQSNISIRLVRLYSGMCQEHLKCEIFHCSLDYHPEFEAISYCWGGNNLSKKVYSTTGSLEITDNCAAALRDLRCTLRDRLLWIDSICIDQSNAEEKSKQIPLMGQIYSKAKRVIIHLGAETRPNVDLFFDFFEREDPNAGRQVTQGGLSAFLSRPWFSRIWVLQEVAVARQVIVMWGLAKLQWEFLSPARLSTLGLMPVDKTGNIPPVLRLSQDVKNPLKDFASFIHTARSCLSTDPRDKIYALLGLLNGHMAQKIIPDYRKSVQDLYMDFTIHIIHFHSHLDILSDIGRQTKAEIDAINDFKSRNNLLKAEPAANKLAAAAQTAKAALERAQHQISIAREAKDNEDEAWRKLEEKEASWKEWEKKTVLWCDLKRRTELWRELKEKSSLWRLLKDQQTESQQALNDDDEILSRRLREGELAWHKLLEEEKKARHDSKDKEEQIRKRLQDDDNMKLQTLNEKVEASRREMNLKRSICDEFEAKLRIWPELKMMATVAADEVKDSEILWEGWVVKMKEALAKYENQENWWQKQDEQRKYAWDALKASERVWHESTAEEEKNWRNMIANKKTQRKSKQEVKAWRESSTKEQKAWLKWQGEQDQAKAAVEKEKERARHELKDAEDAWLKISPAATSLEAAMREVDDARKAWEKAKDAASITGQHPLIESAERAANEHRALQNESRLYVAELNRKISCQLQSENRFIQQDRENLPSWVPDLDKHPCLTTLSPFRTGSCASIYRLPVARLCADGNSKSPPALEIKILQIDTLRSHMPPMQWGNIENFMSFLENGPRGIIHGSDFHSVQRFCQGRRLRRTARSWAICTGQAKCGDKVCAVYGASVPLILRPVSGHQGRFALIGECFLDGFRGPKFADDYLELLGSYKKYFDATTGESLPWETAHLE